MGNYLQSLRVPPQTPGEREHERHHPLYYEWSVPKWSPFRVEQQARANIGSDPAASQGSNLAKVASESSNATAGRNNNTQANKTQPPATGSGGAGGKLAVAAKSAIKTAKEAIHKSLKSTLTSTVDRADSKPANADKTKAAAKKPSGGGGGGKSTGSGAGNHKTPTTREAAHAASSMRKSSNGQSAATIKRVDSTRPQTIDPARNGGIDDQAALKAATNIHTVTSSSSSSSSTRKRVPAS